ncbi:DNA topoisomerase III [Strigomonas culicis]|uniref:DNA topoisomerase n=1 Tax=Strigomonas culicis TaxID=28005 RepID=S9UXJ5_9TRYP|nr:DNA topoisomerase III [Strigomonas culicis]|eukprot:EPY19266.1 DNA topoisomerase III [Strigomonas culicis]
MSTWLHVAEKPSVAKEVANVLSGGRCRTTHSQSKYNPVFEFQFEGHAMLMTSVAGHLMEDEFPPHTKSWTGFPFQGLFSAKITKSVKTELQPIKQNLERLAKRASTLVLWLDCDREGENICFEVIQVAAAQNSRLDVKRARFSALTARDLFHAMRSLTLPDRRLSEAVEARQEMDLRVGAAFTRFQTVKFKDSFEGMPKVLSFGPCQFPTLGFLVRRHWEQQGFVPEDYFTFRFEHNSTRFSSRRGNMYDQAAATLLYDDMLEAAADTEDAADVLQVNQRPSRRRPPVPLATVVLQKLASTFLHIPSERCMTLAESLYQEGLLSYPRTETDSFSFTDSELLELARAHTDNPQVGAFAQAMVQSPQDRFRTPLRGGHDDKAHPPIHPTKAWRAGDDDKGKLYMLVVRHFLACLSPDAVAATTAVVVGFGGEEFTTSGTTVVSHGWMEVYPYERWHSTCIPNYQQGDRFVPSVVLLERHRTAAPPHLTETNLISLMDSNGIGTDATIAQHIKTVLDREYVRREGQSLVPTTLGIALASAYDVLGLTSLLQPQLRAQMELAMADIASGAATKEQVVEAAVRLYRDIFDRLASSAGQFHDALKQHLRPAGGAAGGAAAAATVVQRDFALCGRCGAPMELVQRTEGGFATWSARCGACAALHRLPNGATNALEVLRPPVRCALCGFGAIRVTHREKQTSYTVCPCCFTHPPAAADLEAVGEFRCFQCTADCPLATGAANVAIMRCVACQQSDLRLRVSALGAALLCRGYPPVRHERGPAQGVVREAGRRALPQLRGRHAHLRLPRCTGRARDGPCRDRLRELRRAPEGLHLRRRDTRRAAATRRRRRPTPY